MIELASIIAAVSYVAWGIIHHARRGDLHPKVVLEYLGIALLGVVMVISISRYL